MFNIGQTVKQRETVTDSRDKAKNEIDLVTEKIRSGEALLRVVSYPWGIEFDVCEPPASTRPAD